MSLDSILAYDGRLNHRKGIQLLQINCRPPQVQQCQSNTIRHHCELMSAPLPDSRSCPSMLTASLPLTTSTSLPPWQTTKSIIELYLRYCNCQPLPLFSPQYLRNTLSSREPELLLALISLAARFSHDSHIASSTGYVEESQRLVATRVSQGPVELSTIQTLCILSLREFNRMAVLPRQLYPADSM